MKFNLIFANPNSLIDAQIIEFGLKQISDKNQIKIVNSVYFTIDEADVNIFFDSINYMFLRSAKYNVLIPNLNMFSRDELEFVNFFDLVIAKTNYAVDVIKPFMEDKEKLIYMGWRSSDLANLSIDKNFKEFIINYSNDFVDCQKLIDSWEPHFPNLNIVLNKKKIKLDRDGKANVIFHRGLDRKAYEKLYNKCGVNICLEERCEYPHEIERGALSRSIILTLDKGPCSEIFKDSEGDVFSVYCKKKKLDGGLGSKYLFDGGSLKSVVGKIMDCDDITLKNICRRNYGVIRGRIKNFEDSLKKICRNLVLLNKKNVDVVEEKEVSESTELPNVSIVTLTYNRKEMFRMATLNYNMTSYPQDKIEWIIVDDSDENEGVETHLPTNEEDREKIGIKYVRLESKTELGLKRNIGVEAATNDIVLFMDDDDYYYPDSITKRVNELVNNKGVNCVGITTTGTFDINNFVSSMNVAPFYQKYGRRVTPSSLCFYKTFWESNKFLEVDDYETADFLDNRLGEFREISWEGVMVGLVHSKNVLLRPIEGQKPNGCHFKFSKKLFQFVITLDKNKDLKDDKNLDSIREMATKGGQN
jgi:hypothetical protein